MSGVSKTVSVEIVGGPHLSVEWTEGMKAQQALEMARNAVQAPEKLDFALQYYGSELGYLVVMLNGTFESFQPMVNPNFYWDFLVNHQPAKKGIDGTELKAGDKITFKFERYIAEKHEDTLLGVKYRTRFSNP